MQPVEKKRKLEPMSDTMEHIHIDGSILEGGGQILRIASSLSAILGKTVTVYNIRAGRSKPGLAAQHKTALELVSTFTSGTLLNADTGSTSITFQPGRHLKPMTCIGDTKTAGSACLLAQAALPVTLFANQHDNNTSTSSSLQSKLILKGGTDAAMAPPVDYMRHVLLPILHRHIQPSSPSPNTIATNGNSPQFQIHMTTLKRGFYPRGGGLVEITVNPLPPGASLSPIRLNDRGEVRTVKVSAFVAGPHVRKEVGEAVLEQAVKVLHKMIPNSRIVYSGIDEDEEEIPERKTSENAAVVVIEVLPLVEETKETAVGDGFGCILVAETSTGCILGSAGVNEDKIGRSGVPISVGMAMGECAAVELADLLLAGACVDNYMQDQLILFMALAQGESVMVCREPTLHTRTAMEVCRQLLPMVEFEVDRGTTTDVGEVLFAGSGCERQWVIKCKGAGIIAA